VSARLIGIRGADRELLSIERLALRGIPTEPNTIAALARQIALAIPPGWFEGAERHRVRRA
jgi:hypothetical protein